MKNQGVLIVGAGPVGLALAIELGVRGVPVQVLDNTDGSVTFPAGEAIFSRTMEHLRRWGVADEARQHGSPPLDYPHRIVFMTRVTGRLLTAFDNGASNSKPGDYAMYTPEGPAFLSKFTFLPLLRAAALALPTVQIRYHTEVMGFSQDDEGVTVDIVDQATGLKSSVTASFLVGCDGGRSLVRRKLGIDFAGDFAQGRNYAVHFRAPALGRMLREHAEGMAAQIQTLASARRPYITVVNGDDEWRLSVYLEHDPMPDEAIHWVHEAIGTDTEVEILRAQPWSGHRVVASRYRDGRVFLAGDAAHLLWPKGGFGANTGIGDAVDLGWKLAATLQGWGGAALLESYETERRPIAHRNVTEASSNWSSDAQLAPDDTLDRDDDEGVAARARMAELIRVLRGREFMSIGVQLGYRYRNSPIVIPDGTAEPPDAPDEYTPSTWPGCRAPHAWLENGDSTLDRFGHGYTLVETVGEDDSSTTMAAAAADRHVPFDLVKTESRSVAELYPTRFTLVRPDGHVCWRGDDVPSDSGALLDVVRGETALAAASSRA